MGDVTLDFPEMEIYYAQALSLPLYYDLTKEDVERVVSTLKEVLIMERQKKYSRKVRSRKR